MNDTQLYLTLIFQKISSPWYFVNFVLKIFNKDKTIKRPGVVYSSSQFDHPSPVSKLRTATTEIFVDIDGVWHRNHGVNISVRGIIVWRFRLVVQVRGHRWFIIAISGRIILISFPFFIVVFQFRFGSKNTSANLVYSWMSPVSDDESHLFSSDPHGDNCLSHSVVMEI